ncbi:MAG: GNAT family N-acetyltransferase [Planctomycetia bacterium]|nr:GNAT family N-acetyltransferase [Planctomycetia bacterium]
MIEIRCFRNADPPRLAEVWRAADLGPAAMQPMSAALLEASVFSKPYFDREGLIVAADDDRVVGFAHAAFGPNPGRSGVDTRVGTTLLAAVVPHPLHEQIGAALLGGCEEYLRKRGATTILGGGSAELRSFYLGLYGGSDLPGILDSSVAMRRLFERAGYDVADRIAVLRRTLQGFRPPVNRMQVAIRRSTVLRAIDEPTRRTWWEAATTTGVALRRYELLGQADELLGSASFWDMQPLAGAWGVVAAGLLDVEIAGRNRRQGLAHYLVAEALHDLAQEGVSLVETHASVANTAAVSLFTKLGFDIAEHGTVFRKP